MPKQSHKNRPFRILEVDEGQFVKFYTDFPVTGFLDGRFKTAYLKTAEINGKLIFQCCVENDNGLKTVVADSEKREIIEAIVSNGNSMIISTMERMRKERKDQLRCVGYFWDKYTPEQKFGVLREAIENGKREIVVKADKELVVIKLPYKFPMYSES